ncbi:PepSY domain-containing protein [Gimesia panareensis]|uniref:Uncharacterized protein n=1 Tax=Gimesia panareensis TaxID=2527978 RepID=A0A518AEI5_9PLAN|nr:PepSY domain-containing protein [Gimesia panareensis]QDU50283.1 hypothetical protein Pan110_26280 [Gimesia panareensis]QDU53104.1 hypothetical protein Pan110_54880 [Gimesia panareensis]QDV21633.1 hypothetical protein Pan153_63230 [Gimesia panareensis]
MRVYQYLVLTVALTFFAGCSESIGERKEPIALDKIPADIIKVAQNEHPDLKFESAFTEIEDGQPVYEIRGKTKNGKIIEVEVTKDGKLLK